MALIWSPYSRGTTTATTAAARTRTVRRPCQQRQLQGHRNRQRQQLHQPMTTAAKCALWRRNHAGFALVPCGHARFSEYCAMRVSYIDVGCPVLSCRYHHGNAHFLLDDSLCRSTRAIFSRIIATYFCAVSLLYFIKVHKHVDGIQ